MQTTCSFLITWATTQLKLLTDVPQLEADVLLCHVLKTTRAHLFAFPEKTVTEKEAADFKALVLRRLKQEPIPYLTGHQEFFSLDLKVTPDTLIPRPETELLVRLALSKTKEDHHLIADLGTGSGAIALAIAHERPASTIHATDNSAAALQVAKWNASHLALSNIIFHQGQWCDALPLLSFDLIISNPPYLSEDEVPPPYEPREALVAKESGLRDIRLIVEGAKKYLRPGGFLLIEHGYTQAQAVQKIFLAAGYQSIHSHQDEAGLDRVVEGKR